MAQAPAILLNGSQDEIIRWTFGGKTFRASRRTFAHLWWTQQRLTKRRKGARLVVLQGSYNTDVPASAGTHDWDAVVDVAILGWDDPQAETDFLRDDALWADWWRTPDQGFPLHHHMISRGFRTTVGLFVDGGLSTRGAVVASSQIDDFNRHAVATVGQHSTNSDPQCRGDGGAVTHKIGPVFDYDRFKEDQMALSADDKKWISKEIADQITAATPAIVGTLLDTVLPDGDTVRKSLRLAGDTKAIALGIAAELDRLADAK